ncbi:tRNA-methyl transferase, putative [Leishmania donovani]|uniref:tRNA methyl transferase family protein n=1 Tax=Leishmania donovani TaxID=5661 RepID=A0A3S7WPQ8_LEIDO|nr:tRNA-methyl transferase, putative [Leishmania donovani]AYU76181.1 tRNA-methyl transferase, putative [Leishmania donovani]TPP52431.1 tRNA methyl transferase family protein [Leishmania donovani]CBZ31747.1 tRNA-methyl transferase, putative [Leishmania donovani]
MSVATTRSQLRIAIGLSGGVDSAVTALVLQRCVHTTLDVAALRCFGGPRAPPPPLRALRAAVDAHVPLHELLGKLVTAGEPGIAAAGYDAAPVQYTPFFMRNWHDDNAASGWCERAQVDYDDAQQVARALDLLPRDGTPLPMYDLSSEYVGQCFERMLAAYAAGHTLNVDVLCNSKIKFGALTRALRRTGSAFSETLLATGHYARTWDLPRGVHGGDNAKRRLVLLVRPCSAGRDLNDQTVFLSRVPPSALATAIFPLGHLFTCKADVRALARHSFGHSGGTAAVASSDGEPQRTVAHISRKKTSTGICFVGPPSAATCAGDTSCSSRFPPFLNEYLPPPPPPPLPSTRTVFCDAVTGEELLVPGDTAEHFAGAPLQPFACRLHRGPMFGALRADYPGLLPAYAFTLGQRVRLCRRTVDGRVREAAYYVADKVLAPLPSSDMSDDKAVPVRLLAEVRVVAQWNHALLYASQATVASLHWWLPPPVLHQRAVAYHERGVYGLRCHCCTRHQEALQPATVEWEAADEELSADAEVRVRRARVHFDAPLRAVTPGQALVAYMPLLELEGGWKKGRDASRGDAEPSPPEAMAVIGSGWVVSPDSPPPGGLTLSLLTV